MTPLKWRGETIKHARSASEEKVESINSLGDHTAAHADQITNKPPSLKSDYASEQHKTLQSLLPNTLVDQKTGSNKIEGSESSYKSSKPDISNSPGVSNRPDVSNIGRMGADPQLSNNISPLIKPDILNNGRVSPEPAISTNNVSQLLKLDGAVSRQGLDQKVTLPTDLEYKKELLPLKHVEPIQPPQGHADANPSVPGRSNATPVSIRSDTVPPALVNTINAEGPPPAHGDRGVQGRVDSAPSVAINNAGPSRMDAVPPGQSSSGAQGRVEMAPPGHAPGGAGSKAEKTACRASRRSSPTIR